MAHSRASSKHLRNRRNSEGLNDDFSNRTSLAERRPFIDHSPYMSEEPDLDGSDGNEMRDWSPSRVENGGVHKPPLRQSSLKPPLQSPPFQQMPSGMSTPTIETTRQGNPIATFPPPAPTWRNMPNKVQLAILAGSRFVDFFQMAALQTFMVHQLKSFDPQLPDSVISHQAGVLQGAFTASQIISSILWGRAADQPPVGRKIVLLIGLVGTAFGCAGVGFSKTYGQAVFWRLMSGAIKGTVGSAARCWQKSHQNHGILERFCSYRQRSTSPTCLGLYWQVYLQIQSPTFQTSWVKAALGVAQKA